MGCSDYLKFKLPEGQADFLRRSPPEKKKGFVRVSLCASVANKNIYLFISVCTVGRADGTGVSRAKLPPKREQSGR
jgi:hypothetical protein